MRLLTRLLEPKATAHAHCDLPVRRLRPGAGQDRGRIGQGHRREVPAEHGPRVPGPLPDHQGTAFRAGQAPPVGAVDRLLQAAALREVPAAAHAVQRGHQAGRRGAAPRAARTLPRRTSCWPRSRRSARSSGRPSRADRRAAPYRVIGTRGGAPGFAASGARRAGSQVTQGDIGSGAARFSVARRAVGCNCRWAATVTARRRDVTEDTAARRSTTVPGQRGAGPGAGRARDAKDHVRVCLPAEGAYLSVLRTATAGLAARLDFTLDEIEDLRIAVDEACAMLLVPGDSRHQPGMRLRPGRGGDDDHRVGDRRRARMPGPGHLRLDRALRPGRDASTPGSGPDEQVSIVLRKRRETLRSG